MTDITLPGRMTGLDLVRKARELMPDLKILTISGNASEDFIGRHTSIAARSSQAVSPERSQQGRR